MDVMGGVLLEDGTECKVISGIDDHSRFWATPCEGSRPEARNPPSCPQLPER